MPKFRTKVHEVEAVQIKQPMTLHSASQDSSTDPIGEQVENYAVGAGSWLVTHEDGTQSFMDENSFAEIYEEIPVKRGPGRPPGASAKGESLAAPKRRRRRRHRAKADTKKAA